MAKKTIKLEGKTYELKLVSSKKSRAKAKGTKVKVSGMDRLKANMKKFDNAIVSISKGDYTRKRDGEKIAIEVVTSKNGETFNVTPSTYWKV